MLGYDPIVVCMLDPMRVAEYLFATGWLFRSREPHVSMWTKDIFGSEAEIMLPMDKSYSDFGLRMSEVLNSICRVENRPTSEICTELLIDVNMLLWAETPIEDWVVNDPRIKSVSEQFPNSQVDYPGSFVDFNVGKWHNLLPKRLMTHFKLPFVTGASDPRELEDNDIIELLQICDVYRKFNFGGSGFLCDSTMLGGLEATLRDALCVISDWTIKYSFIKTLPAVYLLRTMKHQSPFL